MHLDNLSLLCIDFALLSCVYNEQKGRDSA